jgi:hypothetical protein
MIQEFITRYETRKDQLREILSYEHPTYEDIVRAVVTVINPDGEYGEPDANSIHKIDDGDYQGTLLFIIPECGYQPSTYWYTMISYGSCSSCDTLQAINDGGSSNKPSERQVDDYMTLALHILQNIRKMYPDE